MTVLSYRAFEDQLVEISRLRRDNEGLRAALMAIARRTAPATRTFDDMIRDLGLANDLARAALPNEEGE